jgi:hypothetical protein
MAYYVLSGKVNKFRDLILRCDQMLVLEVEEVQIILKRFLEE